LVENSKSLVQFLCSHKTYYAASTNLSITPYSEVGKVLCLLDMKIYF
jgi:hypothetical protein